MDGVLHGLSPPWMVILCMSELTVQMTEMNCVHSFYLDISAPWFSLSFPALKYAKSRSLCVSYRVLPIAMEITMNYKGN